MISDSRDPRLEALVLDLVEWVAREPRPYLEVMDAWRTSCPKLAVWEEAVDRGLIVRQRGQEGGVVVTATTAGLAFLAATRAAPTLGPPAPSQSLPGC